MTKAAAAEKAKKTAKATEQAQVCQPQVCNDSTALDRRYGQIGISAVVAALRYQGGAKIRLMLRFQ